MPADHGYFQEGQMWFKPTKLQFFKKTAKQTAAIYQALLGMA